MSTLRYPSLDNRTPLPTLTVSLGDPLVPIQNVRLLLLVIRTSPLHVNHHTPQKADLVSVFQPLYILLVIKDHTRITTQFVPAAKEDIHYLRENLNLTVLQWIVLKYPPSNFPDTYQTHGH